ncbi:M1 family metallopeptidase [Terriglobus saanensis]|uniref:Aminopeptidase n=1 Tax=Terriglobus saanensis (strain ATCC BAA-1853 / DSM 23119 / SP1PR4) TaxID=401053 RepID=E8V3T9_TERSS|nr:M1 family metallopeptidase [Terriglobus saanensis]ADV81353.1 Peptidase M1 membrane alanine aminopeptidase [Terriglobus saanensis SP1PR4]
MHLLKSLLSLSCALALVAVPSFAQRLPAGVRPDHYTLHFTPNLTTATFSGEESIDILLDAPQSSITLNALELKITSVKTESGDTATVSYDEIRQQATFLFAQPLPAGKNRLQIAFRGILNNQLRGFYLSKTAKRNYAVTQFESTDARRAFPSFDEPALKATFDLSLTIDKGDTVISNGPQIADKSDPDPAKHTLTFATTPRMSTYLVAFQVGDFKCSSGKSEGTPIRACATPDKVGMTKFAVKAAEHFLHYYNNYFGIRYPMQKLDMVGLPDFEEGAMENFGCITYRETDLLLDEKYASVPALRRVAVVVAHEMAHQWFGDMVTMQWWDNVWLNEGFANWMESKAVGEWKPELMMRDDEAVTLNRTLDLDSQSTTHPIRARADTPAEIEEMFDGISYGKGGAVIGMVEHYLGEEIFRQGVHNYLAAHLYANATAEDFWNAQTATSHKPIDAIMSSFVEQPGVPLLALEKANAGQLATTQSRFLLSPGSLNAVASWTVPLCLKSGTCQIITPAVNTATLPTNSRTLYANAEDKGYYRTSYSPTDLPLIIADAPQLTAPERIGLIGNQWALVRARELSVGSYLDLVKTLRADEDAAAIDTAFIGIGYLQTRIANESEREGLNAAIRAEYGPVYRALPKAKKHEDPNTRERRAQLFAVLGAAGEPVVLQEAAVLKERYFHHDDSVDTLLATEAIGIAAQNGDAAYYDQVLAWERSAQDPRSRSAALFTLTYFHNPALVDRTLNLAISGEVRNQDSYSLITRLLNAPDTRVQAWTFLKQNWQKANATFTISSGQRVIAATGVFCSKTDREDVAQFFSEHPVSSTERTLKIALSKIEECASTRESQQDELELWLKQNATR